MLDETMDHPQECLHRVMDHLPFPVQRTVLRFAPRLPKLPYHVWRRLRRHFHTRFCGRCGRILPRRWARYRCLCHMAVVRYRFTLAERPVNVFLRPNSIITDPTPTHSKLYMHHLCSAFPRTVFTLSRQSDIVFSLRAILCDTHNRRAKPLACVNGSTCVRRIADVVTTPVFGPVRAKGHGDHFMSFCGREILLLWEALHERVTQDDQAFFTGVHDTVCVYHPQDSANMHRIDRGAITADLARTFGVMRRMNMLHAPLLFYRHERVGALPCEAPFWSSVDDLCKHLFRMKIEGAVGAYSTQHSTYGTYGTFA